MSDPTNILGKIGQKLGQEVKALTDDISAVRTSIGNIDIKNLTGPVSIAGGLKVSVGVSVGGTVTALGALSALRAVTSDDVEVGTDLYVKGDAVVDGDMTVKGTVTKINTIDVEVKDSLIELNKSDDGVATAFDSGLEINTGRSSSTSETQAASAFVAHSGDITLSPATGGGVGSGDVEFTLTIDSNVNPANTSSLGSTQVPVYASMTSNMSQAIATPANGTVTANFTRSSETYYSNPCFVSDDGKFYITWDEGYSADNDSGYPSVSGWTLKKDAKDGVNVYWNDGGTLKMIYYAFHRDDENSGSADFFEPFESTNNQTSSTPGGATVYDDNNEALTASFKLFDFGNGTVSGELPSSLTFKQASSNDSSGNFFYDSKDSDHSYTIEFVTSDYWDPEGISSLMAIGWRLVTGSNPVTVLDPDDYGGTGSNKQYAWISSQDTSYQGGFDEATPWQIENDTINIYDSSVVTSSYLVIGSTTGSSATSGGSNLYPYVESGSLYEVNSSAQLGSGDMLWDTAHSVEGFFSISGAYGTSEDPAFRGDLAHFAYEYNQNLNSSGSDLALSVFSTAFSTVNYDKFAAIDIQSGGATLDGSANGSTLGGDDEFVFLLGLEANNVYVLQLFLVTSGVASITDIARFDSTGSTVSYMKDSGGSDTSTTALSLSGSFSYNITEPTAYQEAVSETTFTDKVHAKFLWDNRGDQQLFKFMLGENLANVKADDVDVASVNIATHLNGDSGLVIGSVSLGTYAHFSSALTAAKS